MSVGCWLLFGVRWLFLSDCRLLFVVRYCCVSSVDCRWLLVVGCLVLPTVGRRVLVVVCLRVVS